MSTDEILILPPDDGQRESPDKGARTLGAVARADAKPIPNLIVLPPDSTPSSSALSFLQDAAVFPFRGTGKFILGTGMGCYFVFFVASSISYLLWPLSVLSGAVTVLFIAYFHKVVGTTGRGSKDAPDWPDLADFFDTVISPLALTLAAVAMSFAAPAIVVSRFGPLSFPSLLAYSIGIAYFPMQYLSVGMTESGFSLNPAHVARSIVLTFPSYLLCCCAMAVPFLGAVLSAGLLQLDMPMLALLSCEFIFAYCGMVFSRLLGLFYFANQDRLGWFKTAR